MSPRRAASASGRSSTDAGKTSETCFASSCSVAVIPMKIGSWKLRIAALVFSPSAVCASSQRTRWYVSRSSSRPWRANHAYVWIVTGFCTRERVPVSTASVNRSAYPSDVRSRLNCETRSRRCVRIRTPRRRAASTNPAAAIVFPDAVGWRKR